MIKKEKKKKPKKKNQSISIGGYILRFRVLRKKLFSHRESVEYVKMMEPRSRPETSLAKLWEKRLGLITVLGVAALLLWVICFTSEPEEGFLSDGRYIQRPDEGETVELMVKGDGETGSWEKQFQFGIEDREFTEEEIDRIDAEVRKRVEAELIGENTSPEHITGRLNLTKEIPGTDVSLSWTYDENWIRSDGTLIRTHIPEEGVDTELMLEAEWRNYKEVYHYPIHLEAPVFSEQELSEATAKKSIRRAIRSQSTEKTIELPDAYRYEEEQAGKNYLPVLLVAGVILAMPFVWKSRVRRSLEQREEELLVDHPGFINKVMLLLGAGLTLRYAFERISGEYERELREGGEKHFVYEELCVTMQELRDGVTEAQAVENFGKRCRCMPYMRFASLITQNLRKGAEGLLVILEKEATESLVERKQTALRQGEKAGTKLLLPMIVMLGLVMSIIMVPAFMTM